MINKSDEGHIMKKTVLAALFLMALCSLGFITKMGTVKAYQQGYTVNDYMVITVSSD